MWNCNGTTAYQVKYSGKGKAVFLLPQCQKMYFNMAINLILSKESSESEIKAYFNAVLELSKSDNEFPINLDEVWMLVYNRKDYAVEALKKDFIENVDYINTSVKTEVGSIKYEYYITLSCMEFFIARKVRRVFEVYRQVFHSTIKEKIEFDSPRNAIEIKMNVADWASKFLNLNATSKLILAKPILNEVGLPVPDYVDSKGILKSATELLKARNCGLSAQGFNLRAIEKGILREIERNTSKGKKKLFKCITEKGLTYGENQVNPNNPKETQPLWYESKFDELLAVLDIKVGRAAV